MRSSKWHAAGNVYLLTEESVSAEDVPALATGTDGILQVVRVSTDTVEIVIWNPDGSRAEMSGNGTRIAARWLADRSGAGVVQVHVGDRIVAATMRGDEVEQDMGPVRVYERERIAGLEVTPVDVGNPHAVVVGDPDDVSLIGPLLERHPRFPSRTNVQVARIDGPGEVTARVWERGVGETLSSGTSAVAVAAATHGEGDVLVHFPGGDLQVRLDHGSATLAGPAERLRVPRQVLVYVFRPGPEFLLLRRTELLGGFWQGVTGAPDWDETDADAAVREVLEETGLDAGRGLHAVDYRYELRKEEADDWSRALWNRQYGPCVDTVAEEVFVVEAPEGWEPTLSAEHEEHRWCGLREALDLLRYEGNREGLRRAARSVGSSN
jgi:diaminopimelate epimerase